MKWVNKHQDLQMFGLKLNKYGSFHHLKLCIAVARHNIFFKCVKINVCVCVGGGGGGG